VSRILLATHGGHGADGAVRVASLLAQRLHATLDVLAVLDPIPLMEMSPLNMGGMAFAPSPVQCEVLSEELRTSVSAQLHRCHVTDAAPLITRGSRALQIADIARTSGASLIMMGLGSHSVIDRTLGGETALQLVQIAHTPVLAVPADAGALPRRVVVAVDFTPTSLCAAQAAAQCLAPGDVLELVHVAPEGLPSSESGRGTTSGTRLRDLASQFAVPSGVEVVAVELQGEPARSLLAYLDGSAADMIALGSHGYGFWKRLAVGSVVSKVVRLATTSVLVAPIGSISVPG
jgi:nucleotide-binding universal stress UspA family protein